MGKYKSLEKASSSLRLKTRSTTSPPFSHITQATEPQIPSSSRSDPGDEIGLSHPLL